MPRPAKGVRLWLRKERRNKAGKLISAAAWYILDGSKHIATGCSASEIVRAETALSEYIAEKYQPVTVRRAIEEIDVADVLLIYLGHILPILRKREGLTEEDEDKSEAIRRFKGRIRRLNHWWGGKTLSEVTGESCRAYTAARTRGGARRDLEDLSAAIGHHLEEGYHREEVKVVMPERGKPRDRWLTRSEAAKIIWACWRAREVQTVHRGPNKGEKIETDKRPLKHLARFILIGLRMGTRAGSIAASSPERKPGRSYVDLERGIHYRNPEGREKTNKRQTPAPIPPPLLAHMRRWVRRGIAKDYFVEWNGKPVKSVKTGFKRAVKLAGIPHATPHSLRHTAATWMMQNGAPLWEAAGFLGMSEKTLRETYGHHHPDFMQGAVAAISGKPRQNVSLVVSLETARNGLNKRGISS
jgi:integrase